MRRVKNNKGMITIEACFLIPFTIMIILVLIWMGFLLYNRTVLTNAVNIATMETAYQAEKSNEELMEYMVTRFEELVRDQLVCVNDIHVEGRVGYGEVELSVSGQLKVPGEIFMTDGYSTGPWSLQVTKSAPRIRKSMVIRTIQRGRAYLQNR